MTQKEFKEALKRGLGRCYIALKTEDKEKFRGQVEWGCLHFNTDNTQSDGFPDEYVYRLVKCYDDPESFLLALLHKLRFCDYENSTDDIRYLARLATLFAKDGSKEAEKTILYRYDNVFAVLQNPDRVLDWFVDFDMEVFCSLAKNIIDIQGKNGLKKVAADIGILIVEVGFESYDFDWILFDISNSFPKYVNALTNVSGEYIDAFLAAYGAFLTGEKTRLKDFYKQDLARRIFVENEVQQEDSYSDDSFEDQPVEENTGILKGYKPLAQTVEEVEKYRNTDEEVIERLERLKTDVPFDELVGYMESYDPLVQSPAKDLFLVSKDERAAEYAKKRIAVVGAEYETVSFLFRNYKEEYKDFLLNALNEMHPEFLEDNWHGIIADMVCGKEDGIVLPTEFLLWGYEASLCRGCRYDLLVELYERGAVDEDMQIECYFDANEDIVDFAEKHGFRKFNFIQA